MKISQAEATLVNLVTSLRQLITTTPDDRVLGRWLLDHAGELKRLHRCRPDILAFIGGDLPVSISIPTRRRSKKEGSQELKLVKGKKR